MPHVAAHPVQCANDSASLARALEALESGRHSPQIARLVWMATVTRPGALDSVTELAPATAFDLSTGQKTSRARLGAHCFRVA
jgi:hypothetical protein